MHAQTAAAANTAAELYPDIPYSKRHNDMHAQTAAAAYTAAELYPDIPYSKRQNDMYAQTAAAAHTAAELYPIYRILNVITIRMVRRRRRLTQQPNYTRYTVF